MEEVSNNNIVGIIIFLFQAGNGTSKSMMNGIYECPSTTNKHSAMIDGEAVSATNGIYSLACNTNVRVQ